MDNSYPEGFARGYVLEVYKGHFEIPSLGPIGANGLANPRHFLYPVAAFVDEDYDLEGPGFTVINKYSGELFSSVLRHNPFDVVAWYSNYAPCKYDLRLFNTINTVSFDHPDPSIFTVLTCPGEPGSGTAIADFVIFPPRWMVATNTFRPPYYHRNCMSEFMGMVHGSYDAKKGFQPGGASLHSCMSPHGPDEATFSHASDTSKGPQEPIYFNGGLAFMFETSLQMRISDWALNNCAQLDKSYATCWSKLSKKFSIDNKKLLLTEPK